MVVPKIVVSEAVVVGEDGHVVVHLVDGLWQCCSWEVVVLLYRHHVGNVVSGEVDKLS